MANDNRERVAGAEVGNPGANDLRNILGDDFEVVDLNEGKTKIRPSTWH